jgi:lysophospholipase L1-like esterase
LGDFLSSRRARRRIRIIAAWAAGVVAAAAVACVVILALGVNTPKAVSAETFTPSPIGKSFVPGLLVIGDSFTGGSDMGGTGKDGWPSLVQLGYTKGGARLQLNLLGRGGAGYVTKGLAKETFGETFKGNAFANQDVAVVFGGINDSDKPAAAVGAAASALYADIKKNSPKVELIVVGPAWPNDTPIPNMLEVRDAIKASALKAGATFIDPIEDGWFTGAAHSMIGVDGTHPDNDGHKFMAGKLSPTIVADVKKAVAAKQPS